MHLFIVLFTYLTTPFAFYDMQVKRLNNKRKAPIERNNICPKISKKENNSDFFILGRTHTNALPHWVMALLIEIQHIPLQNDDSHLMLCMRQALVIIFCGTAYEMVENIEKTKWRRCVKTFTYLCAEDSKSSISTPRIIKSLSSFYFA